MAAIKIGLRLLETLTSSLYDDPIILFREYVQNSIDARNESLRKDKAPIDNFCVAIDIDKSAQVIKITDNGYGIQESEFVSTMTSIGSSNKSAYPDQIGFRGIGRLSAMPFCNKLIFKNKPQGSSKCLTYIWDGEKFGEMLDQETSEELSEAIPKISQASSEDYPGDVNDHFFSVEIIGYNSEIDALVKHEDFDYRLKMMLPLMYDPSFGKKDEIRQKYEEYMRESLDQFCVMVKLNGSSLYKPYKNSNILESGIYFWELRYPDKEEGVEGDKIGILWFTFNRRVTANPANEPYGILVRSKNMLVGDNNALATGLDRPKTDCYIASHRELTQTLQGVYGEMLIHSAALHDNARRDWFKIDTALIHLRDIIYDFMRLLHSYRVSASKAFNHAGNKKFKENLIKAISELTSNYEPKAYIEEFYEAVESKHKDKEQKKDIFLYAKEDIPEAPIALKRFYEKFMIISKEYFANKKDIDEFLKLKSFIKKELNAELKK